MGELMKPMSAAASTTPNVTHLPLYLLIIRWQSQVRNPLPAKARGLPSGSSSSHQACLVRVTSPMWFASYCIGAGVLPCAHPKGSGCGFPLSSKK
uniref:Putative ovule protein n=1 Tax=Solanum chacoense TaxID=4108 RepID=A0A0V0H0Q9_SOLCH